MAKLPNYNEAKENNKLRAHAKYRTPDELEKAVSKYFANLPTVKKIVGDNLIDVPCPTITGLALYLGFVDRQSMYDYEKIEGFSCTIKRARAFITKHYEELLQVGNTTGAIFALKNFGWKDKTEIETEYKNTPTIQVEFAKKND